MKISPKLIDAYIAKPDAAHRAVLLYGPDSGIARERSKQLTRTILSGNDDPFALAELTESRLIEDPALLADELSAISMLSPKRVVIIRANSEKLTGVIDDASAYFNDSVFLIVCADELSTRSSLRTWFEKATNAAAIACYHDDVRDIQTVIRKAFDAAGLVTERDVIDYLSSQLGNDRYVSYQEIEKLITFAGESKKLSLSEAQALVDYNRETNFDDMVNAVADRNLQALEKTLSLVLREGMQPVAYLRALQRYFNRLYFISAEIARGKNAEQVVQSLRPPVFYKQVPILTRHLGYWNTTRIVRALKLLIAAELACKSSDMPIIAASSRRLLQITQIR